MASCDAGSVLLDDDSEQQTQFHLVVVLLGVAGVKRFGVGVISEGHGLWPELLIRDEARQLIVGFNQRVASVLIPEGTIEWEVVCESLFRRFLLIPGRLLLLHEIGVVAVAESGLVQWRYSKDIIVDAQVSHDRLYLTFVDADPVVLNLDTGDVTGGNRV